MSHSTALPRPHAIVRTLRITSGLYLLTYVTLHLINASLGLISVAAMDAARPYLSGFIGHPTLRPILTAALLIHYLIGLWTVYRRPRISGTAQDVIQALSGLSIMPLLAIHAVGTILLQNASVVVSYDFAIRVFWLDTPAYGLVQVVLLSVAWVHGAAGLFIWLRAKKRAVPILPWLYPLAVAVPVLALLGFTEAGRTALISGVGPEIVRTSTDTPLPELPFARFIEIQYTVLWASVAISLAVLLARGLRLWLAKPAVVAIATKEIGRIKGQTGETLLDAFRTKGQPHASLCSGRGRCGTCAVRILSADHRLPAATPLEQMTLDRIDRGDDVRLACQLQLHSGGALQVERLYPPDYRFDERPDTAPQPAQEAPA